MKRLLLSASFAFVLSIVHGQEYGGRKTIIRDSRTIVHKDPVVKRPMMGMPMGMPMGGHMGGVGDLLPGEQFISLNEILGKTITGRAIMGCRQNADIGIQFPCHGGAGAGEPFKDGTRNGWGGNRQIARPSIVSAWRPPTGHEDQIRRHIGGGRLEFDDDAGMYVARDIMHNQAKATGMMSGDVEHNIVKEASHVAQKTISGGVGMGLPPFGGAGVPATIGHQIAKSSGIGVIGVKPVAKQSFGLSPIEHGIVKSQTMGMGNPVIQHEAIKSSSMVGPSMHHNIAKSSSIGLGLSPIGGIGGGMIGHDIAKSTSIGGGMIGHGIGHGIGHDIAKSSSIGGGMIGHGIGRDIGHDIAKSSSIGGGMIGHDIGRDIGHDIAKSSSIGGGMIGHGIGRDIGHDIAKSSSIGGGMIGHGIGHDIAKSSAGALSPFGEPIGMGGMHLGLGMPPKKPKDPVHNVEKVIRSGITSHGHDSLSVNMGNNIARAIANEAARAIDVGSGGRLSMGDPNAALAAKGLVQEAAHVAGETLSMATRKKSPLGSPMIGGIGASRGSHLLGGSPLGLAGHHGGIGSIHGGIHGGSLIHPLPKAPKVPKVPIVKKGGYGGRRRVSRRRPRRRRIHMRNW